MELWILGSFVSFCIGSFSRVHTKNFNRLTNERVEQLVSIKSNLQLFEPSLDSSTSLTYESVAEYELNDIDDEV